MIPRQLRFRDLKSRGIVSNRVTLQAWIKEYQFPSGRLAGPNTRLWDETEVQAWLEARPTQTKPAPKRATTKSAAVA